MSLAVCVSIEINIYALSAPLATRTIDKDGAKEIAHDHIISMKIYPDRGNGSTNHLHTTCVALINLQCYLGCRCTYRDLRVLRTADHASWQSGMFVCLKTKPTTSSKSLSLKRPGLVKSEVWHFSSTDNSTFEICWPFKRSCVYTARS